jgi:hypothetical protein
MSGILEPVFATLPGKGTRFRKTGFGFALGSGNSFPDFVPVEGFLAMIRAAQQIRRTEND